MVDEVQKALIDLCTDIAGTRKWIPCFCWFSGFGMGLIRDPLVHRVSKQNVLVERGVFWFLQKCLSAMLTRSAVATQTLWRRGEFCSAAMLTIQQWPRRRFGEEEISGSGRRSIVSKIMEPNTDTLYCRYSYIVVLKTSPQKLFFLSDGSRTCPKTPAKHPESVKRFPPPLKQRIYVYIIYHYFC